MESFTSLIFIIIVNNVEVNYAYQDQHVDAAFKTYEEAQKYADYFKPYHSYRVIPFLTFKNFDES